MPRPVLILTLAIGAALIGAALAVTAPFHSPALAGKLQCPAGSTIQTSQYKASYMGPGETGISIACVDAQGVAQGSRELETRGFWLLAGIFFVPAFVVLLLAGGELVCSRGAGGPGGRPPGAVGKAIAEGEL